MKSSSACADPSRLGPVCGINVGGAERIVSVAAGGFLLLYGLSKVSLTTIVAAATGSALLYRGLTGHCCAFQALDMSTAGDLEADQRAGRQMHSHPEVTDASLDRTMAARHHK
ncbi:MAG: DUF2892 domain-containing protein [Planctomycetia bacterium]|nr:DUF2892 domain-containing protein [Planctomycetia bacterium]